MMTRAGFLAVVVGNVGLALAAPGPLAAQPKGGEINYDEAKVGSYTLPDPLVLADGTKVADAETWKTKRRPEILRLFSEHVYGRMIENSSGGLVTATSIFDDEPKALGGLATRRQATIYIGERRGGPRMDVLVYIPNGAEGPVPAFLGLNFGGNHAVHPDPAIRLNPGWFRENHAKGYEHNRATDATRGTEASRWQIETALKRGYAVATAYYGDLDPDFDDGFKNGIHPLLDPPGTADPNRPKDAWGSIGAWAWGLSRALDYLQTVPEIDGGRVAVLGHSRLGKTSLWAGAQDERFALVISNDSGEGGAALARRPFGETVRRINTAFPHWFCDRFAEYNDRVADLPVDQHELLALVAPRPVLVCSAQDDQWADPRGEFLSAVGADPVYRLLGTDGLKRTDGQALDAMPGIDQPILSTIGYHIRAGAHDVTARDWAVYLDFADKHLKR